MSLLFGRFSGTASEPWTSESVYKAIRSGIDPASGRIVYDKVQLPDEAAIHADSQIRWAPGAMDGVFGHHMGPGEHKATAARLAKLIDEVARSGDLRSTAAAYALMKEESVLGLIDPMIEHLGERGPPIEPHLAQFALKLATESADRGPVKVGLALLGIAKLEQHREVVETLGLHDEFTLFSAVALGNMLEDAETALWQLASKVDGWGRIQIVERMAPIQSEQVRYWLRTEGFRNSIMYEYLALTAAEQGKLREALDRARVPPVELVAASEIIDSMIMAEGGPGAGMNDYSDAAATCLLYLRHVEHASPDLHYYLAIHALIDYVQGDDRPTVERLANGWSESAIAETQRLALKIVGRSVWSPLIHEQLDAADPVAFHQAAAATGKAGIDSFPWHWKRLQENPTDSIAWHCVMRQMSPERIDPALALAEQHLPLDKIATGPAEDVAIGPEFAMHRCLDAVLQELAAFPGKGSRLIGAGLLSPVVRNRHLAMTALERWNPVDWCDEIRQALERARASETNEELSERLTALSR